MNVPKDLKYRKTHEWLRVEGKTALIGITDHAQSELGDIVFVGLPETGALLVAGESFADVESVKAVSDVLSPVSGTVSEVNEAIADNPEAINQDPYGAWFVRVQDFTEEDGLLTPEEYSELIRGEE